jgi:asparagine synthase (glutamine-hydrolysing)
MEQSRRNWEEIIGLLTDAGQPFADTSIFAAHAICRLMRQHVTVALSGDGGDEAFGGYDFYWQLSRIARLQALPGAVWHGASFLSRALVHSGVIPASMPRRLAELADADDVSTVANLFSWTREEEHRSLCPGSDLLPISRLFERQWEHCLPAGTPRPERLSALATEANVRLVLANDFLFKVDTASMRQSMEVRVPFLDEDLFEFGLSLPQKLKVDGRTCKKVLRSVAHRRLPLPVASKAKWGFMIPVDTWLDRDSRSFLRDALLSRSSQLPEFFEPAVYTPWIEAFCDHQRVMMLLSVELTSRNIPLVH